MIYLPLALVGVLLVLVLPVFPWSRGWGGAPAGIVGVVFLTVLLFLVAELLAGAG